MSFLFLIGTEKHVLTRFVFLVGAVILLLALQSQYSEASGELIVGVYENVPIVFTDENGLPAGIIIDILKSVAAKEKLTPAYKSCEFAQCLEMLESGEINLMPAVAFSESRQKRFLFSKESVLANWAQIYTQKSNDIQSLLDLENKKIAVLNSDIHVEKFKEILGQFDISSHLINVDSYQDVFNAILDGRADAGLVNRTFGYWANGPGDLRRTPILLNPINLLFSVKKGTNEGLLTAIDSYLREEKSRSGSEYFKIIDKWLSPVIQHSFPYWLKWVFVALLTSFLSAGFFLFLFRMEIKRRTAQLARANTNLREEIQERLFAEGALQESEKRYRLLFEIHPWASYPWIRRATSSRLIRHWWIFLPLPFKKLLLRSTH